MTDLNTALQDVYASVIRRFHVDLPNKKVQFDLESTDYGNTTTHKLAFTGCTSCLWVEKMKDNSTFDFQACDYYELTSVLVRTTTATSTDPWLRQYPLEYNIAVEIWDSALLLHAQEVCMDGFHFPIPELDKVTG